MEAWERLEKSAVRENLPANIYAYENEAGDTLYAVCEWDESASNYYRPLDCNESRLTGCTGQFSRRLPYMGGFTKKQAYGRARTLFGYAKINKE